MNSNYISLSRLAITGIVTPSTPLVVLKEIADAHGIGYEEENLENSKYLVSFVNKINTQETRAIRKPFDMRDYRLIARFINKNVQWRKRTIIRAFDFLMKWTDKKNLGSVGTEFSWGLQTPENPETLNASVLYGICKYNKIQTHRNSTIQEMASNIKLLLSLKNPTIHHSIRQAIYESMMYGGCEDYQLINILSQIDPDRSSRIFDDNNSQGNNRAETEIVENIETTNEIIVSYEELRDIATGIRNSTLRTNPHTHLEAIAMAAINYKMDISGVRNPLAEYQELRRTPFFPLDRELAKRLRETNNHPDSVLNPRLDKVFNPNLPANLYSETDLQEMCIAEGYTEADINEEGSYTLLQTSYLMPTFLHGKQGNISNDETAMMEDVVDLNYDEVVVYGIRDRNFQTHAYTYGELLDSFTVFRRFQRPNGNAETFSDLEIQKLYILCHADQKRGESDHHFHERLRLGEKIEQVRLYLDTNQEQVREFIDKYHSYELEERERIEGFMTMLMESAMYMRGWTGEGPYPLSTSSTYFDHSEHPNMSNQIDLRVTQSIAAMDMELERLNEIDQVGDLIKELPLMFYDRHNGELNPSTDQEEGITIYDRINIVKQGENTDSIRSCIRMSSNRFAASAYYYMQLMSMSPGFNINELDHIS